MRGQFVANGEAFIFFRKLCKLSVVFEFLTPRLQCKISLSISNHRFSWITILNNQIASITRQTHIGNFALGTRANPDHFVDVNKMVCNCICRHPASLNGLFYHLRKVAPFLVVQQRSKLTCIPIFIALLIDLANAFKRSVVLIGNALNSHGVYFV